MIWTRPSSAQRRSARPRARRTGVDLDMGNYFGMGRSSSAAKETADVIRMWFACRNAPWPSRCPAGHRCRSRPSGPARATPRVHAELLRHTVDRVTLRGRVLRSSTAIQVAMLTQLAWVRSGWCHDSRPPWIERLQTMGEFFPRRIEDRTRSRGPADIDTVPLKARLEVLLNLSSNSSGKSGQSGD